MKLTDWQERLINERDILESKLQRINQFLRDTEKTTNIHPDEIIRIKSQRSIMVSYYKTIGERICNFEVDNG